MTAPARRSPVFQVALAVAGLIVIAVVAIAVMHETLGARLLERAARSATGLQVEIAGPFRLERLAPLRIEARDVTVSAEAGGATVGIVGAEIPLGSLLAREPRLTELTVRDARVEVPRDRTGRGPPRLPVIERLALANVRLAFALRAEGDHELAIARLEASAEADGRIRAEGEGDLDGEAWRLDGTLGTLPELIDPDAAFPVQARVEIPGRQLTVEASGRWDDPLAGRGAELDLTASLVDTGWLVAIVAPGAPLSGALEASGRLKGGVDAMGVTGLDLRLDDGERLSVEVSGDAEDLGSMAGLDLDTTVTTTDEEVLRWAGLVTRVGVDSGQMHARIAGSPGEYRVQEIDLVLAGPDARTLEVRGDMDLDQLRWPAPVGAFRLDLAAAAPTGDFRLPALGEDGRIDAQATVSGTDEGISVDAVALTMIETRPIAGTVSGRGELLPGWPNALLADDASGRASRLLDHATLDLELDLSGDARRAGALVGVELPDTGPFSLRTRVSGGGDRVDLTALDWRITGGDPLAARIQGSLALTREGAGWSARDVAVDIEATGPDAGRMPGLPRIGAIGHGAWKLRAELASSEAALTVPSLRYEAGSEKVLRTELEGEIAALGPVGPSMLADSTGLAISTRMASESTRQAGTQLGLELPELGEVEARFDATLEPEGWALRELKGSLRGDDGLILDVRGALTRVPGDPKLEVEVEGRTESARSLAQALGLDLPVRGAASLDGELEGTRSQGAFDGRLSVGSSVLAGRAALDLAGERPRLEASLSTPELDLDELEWLRDATGSTPQAPDVEGSPETARLFAVEPLDLGWIEVADTELTLEAEVLRGGAFRAGPLTVRGGAVDRRMRLFLEKISLEAGEISATVELDASRSPPAFSLVGQGKHISLGKVHEQLVPGANRLEGLYAFDVDLRGTGRSPHEIASTLEGRYGHVVVDGRLPGGDLDLFSLRPLAMVLTFANTKDHTRVDCAVMELRATDGVVSTESMFLRTGKVLVTGVGSIDLSKEKVDLVVHAKPMRKGLTGLFQGQRSARIHGPVTDPKLDADTSGVVVGAAAEGGLLGAAAFTSPVFVGVVGIDYLKPVFKSEAAESCRPGDNPQAQP